jgi:hypothetical protein
VLRQPVVRGGAAAFGLRKQRQYLCMTKTKHLDLSLGGEQLCDGGRGPLLDESHLPIAGVRHDRLIVSDGLVGNHTSLVDRPATDS